MDLNKVTYGSTRVQHSELTMLAISKLNPTALLVNTAREAVTNGWSPVMGPLRSSLPAGRGPFERGDWQRR